MVRSKKNNTHSLELELAFSFRHNKNIRIIPYHSLKLTTYSTRKYGWFGIRYSFLLERPLVSGAFAVSFREGIFCWSFSKLFYWGLFFCGSVTHLLLCSLCTLHVKLHSATRMRHRLNGSTNVFRLFRLQAKQTLRLNWVFDWAFGIFRSHGIFFLAQTLLRHYLFLNSWITLLTCFSYIPEKSIHKEKLGWKTYFFLFRAHRSWKASGCESQRTPSCVNHPRHRVPCRKIEGRPR